MVLVGKHANRLTLMVLNELMSSKVFTSSDGCTHKAFKI